MILQGDARSIPLADQSVQCVVTSPPYWGLRNYGVDGQIGLEKTPELYVQTLVEVFREVRRVLRDDGTVWLNLGDSYAAGGQNSGSRPEDLTDKQRSNASLVATARVAPLGLKPKDLVGIPWRVALALQADGWYLRSDIIWNKPNPMPESVTDRPTRSHEYVFLLTKSARYYYDHEAVKERGVTARTDSAVDFRRETKEVERRIKSHRLERDATTNSGTRNARSVWTITPKPYKGAHFATFPPELPTRCIKAGTPEGGSCATCMTPLTRLIEKGAPLRDQQIASGASADGTYDGTATKDFAAGGAQDASATKARILAGMVERRTIGWRKTCRCSDTQAPVPAVVFDPFGGTSTTVLAAEILGRVGISLDLNPAYVVLAQARVAGHTHTPSTINKPGTADATSASMPAGRQA